MAVKPKQDRSGTGQGRGRSEGPHTHSKRNHINNRGGGKRGRMEKEDSTGHRTNSTTEEAVSQTWSAKILVFGSRMAPPLISSSTAMSLGSRERKKGREKVGKGGGDRRRGSIMNSKWYLTRCWADASPTSGSTTSQWYDADLLYLKSKSQILIGSTIFWATEQQERKPCFMRHCQFSLVEPCFVPMGFIKVFLPNLRCFQSAITANSGKLHPVVWRECSVTDPHHPQGISHLA